MAALPAAALAAGVSGPVLWWFDRRYFDAPRAAGFAATLAVLVGGSLLLLAVLPRGRWRGRSLAALPGVWVAALGAWCGVVWLGTAAAWLLIGIGLAVVAGGAEIWLWWWGHGRRRPLIPVAATAVLLALIPAAFVYWVWHQSAHFGTAGEPDPKAAVDAFMGDLAPVVGTVQPDIDRVICHDDPRGRRVVARFVADWRASFKSHPVNVTWVLDRPTIHGDTATVRGAVMMNVPATDGSAVTFTMPKTRWTFRLAHEDGWRVCGLTVPNWSPTGSASPSPAPEPSTRPASPSPSKSSDDDDDIPGGAPSDMQKCGPNDPYKNLGWYDCPD
ncbi:hypothetical protein AB0I55_24685 [Actinocatenispora sera]|uniref:hypothetical protein n=1 Tax=Actinocatenispora sera TaxID=390989 RepID=UPI0033C77458